MDCMIIITLHIPQTTMPITTELLLKWHQQSQYHNNKGQGKKSQMSPPNLNEIPPKKYSYIFKKKRVRIQNFSKKENK